MTDTPDDLVKIADALPKDVRRWVLRGGAVPDAVWFGDYSFLKQSTSASTWRRSDVCERLAKHLRSATMGDA